MSFLKIIIENFNAQTSELDLTTGVKGREVKISLHQKKKRVAFGLKTKQFSQLNLNNRTYLLDNEDK